MRFKPTKQVRISKEDREWAQKQFPSSSKDKSTLRDLVHLKHQLGKELSRKEKENTP